MASISKLEGLLEKINAYSGSLKKASIWAGSEESIAYVKKKANDEKGVNYIFEFYCYMRIINDLSKNYSCKYIPGSGKNPHKFPQASALKKDKPRFDIIDKTTGKRLFQVCAGTKINGKYSSEKDHPDISFQKDCACEENPDCKDLIMIFDAKFQLNDGSTLKKGELDKFESILRRLNLNKNPDTEILFDEFKDFNGNCLITNVKCHSTTTERLKGEFMKEVEFFFPNKTFKVIG